MSNLTSIVPTLIDALIAAATTALPSVVVTDGITVTMQPGDYLFVGVDDPDVTRWTTSSATQDWAVATMTARNEVGTITCAAHSWTGNAAPKAARDAVFATAGAVQTLLRDKTSLNVPGMWKANYTAQNLTQYQDDDGAYALLVFQIAFDARI